MPEPSEAPQGISAGVAALFYAILALVAWLLGTLVWSLDLWVWPGRGADTPLWLDATLGAGFGLAVVVLGMGLDRVAQWARRLNEAFVALLGELSLGEIFVIALASSIGEELFFRGFLQQILSEQVFSGAGAQWLGLALASLAFGLVHIGPDLKTFWPWTAMALVLGTCLGALYLYTGNLLAPILAHFTINFLNLSLMVRPDEES